MYNVYSLDAGHMTYLRAHTRHTTHTAGAPCIIHYDYRYIYIYIIPIVLSRTRFILILLFVFRVPLADFM